MAAQALSLVALVCGIVLTITMRGRMDLLHPTTIGSDPSNYYAAGQRLNVGHPLYALSPGDRPVPMDPPYLTCPLLSPPPIAVLWRVLALLPGYWAMTLWALCGGLLLAATAARIATRVSLIGAVLFLLVLKPVCLTTWSGNVNAYLTVLLVLVWIAEARGHSALAGAMAGVVVATKLVPALLLVWFLAAGDRRAALAMIVAGVLVALLGLAGAGTGNHVAYLGVMRYTYDFGATPWSAPGVLERIGVPAHIAHNGILMVAATGAALVVVLRRRPTAGFFVALLAGVYSTPVASGRAMALAAVTPFLLSHSLLALRGAPAHQLTRRPT